MRLIRLPLVKAMTPMPATPRRPPLRNSQVGAPATASTAATINSRIIEVPRSWPASTSASTTVATGMT